MCGCKTLIFPTIEKYLNLNMNSICINISILSIDGSRLSSNELHQAEDDLQASKMLVMSLAQFLN